MTPLPTQDELANIFKLNFAEISTNVKKGTNEFPKTIAAIQALFLRIVAEARPATKEHSGVSFSDFTQDLIDAEKKGYNQGVNDYATALKQRIEKEKP